MKQMKQMEAVMSEYQLVVSDLDSTLFGKPGRMSEENQQAIEELVTRGVTVVPCTGRTIMETPSQIRDNPMFRYYIHSNGAVVYDKKTNTRVNLCMTLEDGNILLDIFNRYTHRIWVRFEGHVYQLSEPPTDDFCAEFDADPGFLCAKSLNSKLVDDLDATCRNMDGIEMISAFFRNMSEMESFLAELDATGRFSYASNDVMPNCHVYSKRAGKGNGLKALMELLKCDRERTISVGDGTNDISMIRAAGLGLAVSNACPQLLAEADEVICSNMEHIMPYILKRYIQ